MEIIGTYSFAAAPERVWSLLQDPEVIASCIPGCDRFEPDGDDRYRVRLTVALAAITGTYDGTVSISEKIPPTSYRLIAEAQGRCNGIAGRQRGNDRGGERNGADSRHGREDGAAAHRRRVTDDDGPLLPLRRPLLRGVLDRVDDVLVARAAAEVAGDARTNLLFRRFRRVFQEVDRRQDHLWRALAALEAVLLPKPFLERMQLAVRGESLDCGDLGPTGLHRKYGAGLGAAAVDEDRAGAALAGVAAHVRTREQQFFAEEVHQEQTGLRTCFAHLPVDRDLRHPFLLNETPETTVQRTVGMVPVASQPSRLLAWGDGWRTIVGLDRRKWMVASYLCALDTNGNTSTMSAIFVLSRNISLRRP
jgi:hypothetical protein